VKATVLGDEAASELGELAGEHAQRVLILHATEEDDAACDRATNVR
jgi:hypothetical protein